MTTRTEIIAEARTYKGTKWSHQGRLKNVGVDCAGLVVKVGEKFGLVSHEDATRTGYGREPDTLKMKAALDQVLDRIPKEAAQPADIVWLKVSGDKAQHLGILSERNTLIHAINFKCVEEMPIEASEKTRIVAAYRYRGLQ